MEINLEGLVSIFMPRWHLYFDFLSFLALAKNFNLFIYLITKSKEVTY